MGLVLALYPHTSWPASLEWDSQLLRLIILSNPADETQAENIVFPNSSKDEAALPNMPDVPMLEDMSEPPSATPVETETTEMRSVLFPDGRSQSAISQHEERQQITDRRYVSQIAAQDAKQNLILTSFAHMPIDRTATLPNTTYALSVNLYDLQGQTLNNGRGSLTLDLASHSLQFHSLHALSESQQLSLSAEELYKDGWINGSLEANLSLEIQLTGSASETHESTLNALRANTQIVGTLATHTANPHFGIVGFISKDE